MRVLFVTPTVPFPPLTGSALIALNHIRCLAVNHTVDLISFKDRKKPNELGELRHWCNSIELLGRPPRWRVLLNILSSMTRDPHPDISRSRSAEMSEVVNRRLAETTYDVVLFQLVQSAQFRPSWYQGPTIWNLEDPLMLKSRRMLPMYPWYLRPVVWSWIYRLTRYNKRHAARFDRVIFVNKEDSREYTRIVNEARSDWVPSGIDVETFCPSQEIARRDGNIVITGNMFHTPNVDAVEFFCREVFPLVCRRVQSANLWLVGARPVGRVRKLARDSRIHVTGFVPDIRPFLQQAMVSVCPVRLRIGTQTKILEALACGTPVVTSSAGNHGINAISGEHLYIADDPEEFADKTVMLLKGERWSELSKNGRRFVEENFTWSKSVLKLEGILEQVAATDIRDRGPSASHA
jgi:glycosyltransferase involved in cell wall biosynthesis